MTDAELKSRPEGRLLSLGESLFHDAREARRKILRIFRCLAIGSARSIENQMRCVIHQCSILIVDEVWESGRTLALVAERARAAGANVRTAVVHHKPGKSEVPGAPDFSAALADGWITYPYKGGE